MYRKFKDSQKAIHYLIQGEPESDWVEIFEDPNALPDPNYVPPYTALRRNAYPQIESQLDMLWHELNISGSISTSGTWFNSIKNVKDQFPKP